MLFDPTAVILADRGQRHLFASALPDAPVVEERRGSAVQTSRRLWRAREWHARPASPRLAG